MDFFVTDKRGYAMSISTSEKLKIIEPDTYEECFPFEGKTVFCYFKGIYKDCEEYIKRQDSNVIECLEIEEI